MRALWLGSFVIVLGCGSSGAKANGSPDGGNGSPDAANGSPDGSSSGGDASCTVIGQACTQDSDCACGGICAATGCVAPLACSDALVQWNGPVANEDGTCLTDLAGFTIHYGQEADAAGESVVDAGRPCVSGPSLPCGDAGQTATQLLCADVLHGFSNGTTYFTAYAYSTANVESPSSGQASKTFACP